MTALQKGVATLHRDYGKFSTKWKRCRDVSDGQDAMHAATTAYLPMLKDEEQPSYEARVKRSDFFNGTWRTLSILNGMMFRKPPTMEVPAAIEGYLKDVDLAGASLDTFARTIGLETLEVGRLGILVDHPPAKVDDEGNVVSITRAAAEADGVRPTLQFYRAESIINWKHRRIRNRHQLSMVVLEECVTEADGEFAEKEVKQYRVLDLDEANQYRIRVFQRKDDADVQIGNDTYPLMNGNKLDYIPFAIVGVDGIESTIDEPPLIDLVDCNIAHYQINSDYRHGLHFTGNPQAIVAGYQKEESEQLYIGSTKAWVFPDPAAKAFYMEFTGQGLEPMERALDRKEKQMALLGARAIADETQQAETLGATQIKRGGENSILASIAMAVSEALEWALGIFAEWSGHPAEIVYQLNRDFMPVGMSPQYLQALLSTVQAGEMSSEEFFTILQRHDVIETESFEEHQEKIASQSGPARPDPVVANDEEEDDAA